jgi:hypothetical protein
VGRSGVLVVTAMLAITVARCASTLERPRGPTPSLDEEMAAVAAPSGAVPWSASRRLAWTDFRADAPAAEGPESALTAYSLLYGLRCERGKLDIRVVAAFLPEKSWVKRDMLRRADDSRQALQHEQTHFDLSEVHARRMRKYFPSMYDPCGRRDSSLTSLAEGFVEQESAAQALYDQETDHGRKPVAQRRWDASVAGLLSELGAFAP